MRVLRRWTTNYRQYGPNIADASRHWTYDQIGPDMTGRLMPVMGNHGASGLVTHNTAECSRDSDGPPDIRADSKWTRTC